MNRRLALPAWAANLKMDWWLLAAALLLMALGLMMVLSASGIMAERFYEDKYYFFKKQLMFAGFGLGIMGVAALVPRKFLYDLKYVWLLLATGLLLAVLASPLGVEANGARRWINLGLFQIQPMEFAKIALVLYLAWFFSAKRELVRSFGVGVVPPFAVTGLLCLLLLMQPDFGGAAVMAVLLFFMCLAGGVRPLYLGVSLILASGGAWLLITQSAYRSRRLLAFLDPFEDALDTGYQLVQSLYALGSGGFWGAGLGAGTQKLFFLPEAHNDFILAVVGEELGFVGVSIVFALMGLLVWRAFTVAVRQREERDRYAAFGMALVLTLGAVLNTAVALGAAPPKGVPLPFMSYGGSSLLASFLCVGLLLNISRPKGPQE